MSSPAEPESRDEQRSLREWKSAKKSRKAPREFLRVALGLELQTSYSRQKLQGILAWMRKHGNWRIEMREGFPYLSKKQLLRWRGDGIIGAFHDQDEASEMAALGIPVVNTSGMAPGSGLPTVCLDDEAIGRLAANHLIERGFRDLHYFSPESHADVGRLRYLGFEKTARSAGVAVQSHWIDASVPQRNLVKADPYLKRVRGIQGEAGIFCVSDRVAYGLLEACRQLGIPVPNQLSVVGSNNDEVLCQLAHSPLTSVDESTTALGYRAAGMLHQLMGGSRLEERYVKVAPAGIRVRASSDRLPRDSGDLAIALRFIRDHAHEAINVPDVLRLTSVSRRSLEMLFLKEIGHGIYDEIRRVHIGRAEELLRDTDLPVIEIARRSGFRSLNRFEITFKNITGSTPAAYRKRHLSKAF